MQEWQTLRYEGVENPNPWQQVLANILTLIVQKRYEGYAKVMVNMDFNGKHCSKSNPDNELVNIINDTGLMYLF